MGRAMRCDFALFKASKTIRREASDIWLSESLFSFTTNSKLNKDVFLPAYLTDRMKSVELYFPPVISTKDLTPEELDVDYSTAVFKTVVAPFTGSHILRNSLKVDFIWLGSDNMTELVLGPIFEIFKAVTGFTTVTLVCEYFNLGGPLKHKELPQVLGKIGQVGRSVLEPILGPATEEHVNQKTCLTFHP